MKKNKIKLIAMQIMLVLLLFVNHGYAQSDVSSEFPNGTIVSSENATIRTQIRIANQPYDNYVLGVFYDDSKLDEVSRAIFKPNFFISSGITYVRYNSESGTINMGDYITTSSTPGIGMKATETGMVIGVALENAVTESGLLKIRILIQYVKQ